MLDIRSKTYHSDGRIRTSASDTTEIKPKKIKAFLLNLVLESREESILKTKIS